MEKNEKGFPITPTRVENLNENTAEKLTRDGCGSGDRTVNDARDGCGQGSCGGTGAVDMLEPAYVYAPRQKFCMLYSNDEALWHGTLFEQLYKPMEVYGRE